MNKTFFEIRVCQSCGLRYPLNEGHSFGERCPHCLGGTEIALRKEIGDENIGLVIPNKASGISILLDNIRSAWNVGSIFRSADGFGFEHVYLCGITPSPDVDAVKKTSLGAEDSVTWSHHKDAVKLIKGLKKEGWTIWSLEEDARAKELGKGKMKKKKNEKTVLILGSETTGVDPELLNLCDEIFYIPMRGTKRSFNVAMAFSIAAFALS